MRLASRLLSASPVLSHSSQRDFLLPGTFEVQRSAVGRSVLAIKSSMSSGGPMHGHSGTTVPADADIKAAKEGEAQMCGSGVPLDKPSSDAVHGHSGTSVPPDTDVKAAKEGEPQFVGSGKPLDVNTEEATAGGGSS